MANYRWAKVACALALALGVTASSLGIFAFAATHSSTASAHTAFTAKLSAKKGPQLAIQNLHTVNAAAIPKASQTALQQANRPAPLVMTAQIRAKEAETSLAERAAAAPHNAGEKLIGPQTSSPLFPSTFNKFAGQSASACGNSNCSTTDPAIAAAPTGLALQVVDSSLALYNNNGTLQSGWPKTAKAFFGVPNPSPSGCDAKGPFLFAPGAWFDAYDNRFGVAMLQVEGADGVATSCSEVTTVWVATSTSTNPSGTWRIFSFNMSFGTDPTAFADTLQYGFDADGLFFSSNMYPQAGGSFEYAEVVGCGKQGIYGGSTTVCNTYFGLHTTNINSQTIELDTIAPVESLATDFSPHAEFLVDTFNFQGDLNAHNCTSTKCNGIIVWSWTDPANTSGSGDILEGVIVSTARSYIIPPNADEPSCTGGVACLFDGYNGIVGTPTYHAGHIYAAQETGVINASSQNVSGIQWFDLEPQLTPGWPAVIDFASEDQDGILNATNNWLSCINPVIMPDLDNDLVLGYDYTGDTQNPSINYTFRRVTDQPDLLSGGLGIVETAGTGTTTDTSWGLYSAMSYPATYQDFIWLTSPYATSSSEWNTELLKLRFNLNG